VDVTFPIHDFTDKLCLGVYHRYDDLLTIPIIENTCHENELEDAMARCMKDYPEAPAVLVRRHGLYVWGPTWQKAKTMYVLSLLLRELKIVVVYLFAATHPDGYI